LLSKQRCLLSADLGAGGTVLLGHLVSCLRVPTLILVGTVAESGCVAAAFRKMLPGAVVGEGDPEGAAAQEPEVCVMHAGCLSRLVRSKPTTPVFSRYRMVGLLHLPVTQKVVDLLTGLCPCPPYWVGVWTPCRVAGVDDVTLCGKAMCMDASSVGSVSVRLCRPPLRG
jgi:hypothetical protein